MMKKRYHHTIKIISFYFMSLLLSAFLLARLRISYEYILLSIFI
jgi:hypothetical protein